MPSIRMNVFFCKKENAETVKRFVRQMPLIMMKLRMESFGIARSVNSSGSTVMPLILVKKLKTFL